MTWCDLQLRIGLLCGSFQPSPFANPWLHFGWAKWIRSFRSKMVRLVFRRPDWQINRPMSIGITLKVLHLYLLDTELEYAVGGFVNYGNIVQFADQTSGFSLPPCRIHRCEQSGKSCFLDSYAIILFLFRRHNTKTVIYISIVGVENEYSSHEPCQLLKCMSYQNTLNFSKIVFVPIFSPYWWFFDILNS